MKKILTAMCMCDPKKRPDARALMKSADFIKLVGRYEEETNEIEKM